MKRFHWYTNNPMATAIRLLMIHKQLSFSLKIKRTLEQLGGFEVSPFTTLETASDFLRKQAQHIALIDFTLPGTTGLDIVLRLRSIQPDILIIASPDLPQVAAIVHQMNLAGIVDAPLSARDLIPALRQALKGTHDVLADTAEAFIITGESETVETHPRDERLILRASEPPSFNPEEHSRTIELVLRADVDSLREEGALPEGMTEEAVQLFQHLAAEEPPVTLEDAGTIHDLRVEIRQVDLERVDDAMRAPAETDSRALVKVDPTPVDISIESALRVVHDESVTLEQLYDALQVEFPDTRGIEPLPSWVENLKRYVHEPDFLDNMGETGSTRRDPLEEYFDSRDVLRDVRTSDNETEILPKATFNTPIVPNPLSSPVPPDGVPGAKKPATELPPYEFQPPQPERAIAIYKDEGLIAQMALSLMHAALDMTAELAVLAWEGEVVSHRGVLPLEEVENVSDLVGEDWDAKPGEARVRFVTLSGSGQDYMIYSRRTEDGFTLSLVFEGNMPLRVMRVQTEKILRALQSIPELPAHNSTLIDQLHEREMQKLEAEAAQAVEAAIETTAEITREHGESYAAELQSMPNMPVPTFAGTLAAYTFIWTIREERAGLDARLQRMIALELDRQLTDLGWTIENLQVYEDYIYLLGDVPGDAPSHMIVHELKQRSAWIAHAVDVSIVPEQLWADTYCVLSPGREMDIEEIQRYINFARS